MAQPSTPGPKPATTATPEAAQSKRDLTSWWRTFKRGNPAKLQEDKEPQGIFGIPLQQSIRYANVAISLFNDEGQSYIYGYVPIVVAKCGVFLKEKATDVEGIFRLSGSEKRIKELKFAFDSPDRYGKGLDWTGYTVHDAANILRRYFNQLPEPIIPLDFYQRFREPLRNHQAQAVGPMDLQGPVSGPFSLEEAIRAYQSLITELPPLNRQLLLYILDLLAVFASKSDLNKMTTANLAAIFQPGLLSHPQHDMAPAEYRLSQDVLIFLIENQDHFLIGMHGTAADEKTVRDVQSAAQSPRAPSSPTTPQRSKTLLGRSGSTASAGAESVRKFGNLRRNMSVSSKTSKRSAGPQAPATPTTTTGNVSSALGRSNTVPSKRSGASPRFPRDKSSDPPTPSPGLPPTVSTAPVPEGIESDENTPIAEKPAISLGPLSPPAPPEIISASSSEATTPLAAPVRSESSTRLITHEQPATEATTQPTLTTPVSPRDPSAERSPSGTGTPSRVFLDIFKPSPTSSDDGKRDGRRPNKLQKKRIPGSALSSAQSSAHSLQEGVEGSEEQRLISPVTPNFEPKTADYMAEHAVDQSAYATAQSSPRYMTPVRTQTDSTLRPAISPSHSYRSRASHELTDLSDADYATDATHGSTSTPATESTQKKRRWRVSQPASRHRDREAAEHGSQTPQYNLAGAEHSKSTVASGGAASHLPRSSFQESPRPLHAATEPEMVLSDSDERKKGPMSWIRGKIAERKERADRARSPNKMQTDLNASRNSLALGATEGRGKSIDVPRGQSQGSTRSAVERFGDLSEDDVQKAA